MNNQDPLQHRFVERVLGGVNGYPPSGWHDLNGETGRSALMWSLCSWRQSRNGRATLYIPLSDPYDYWHTCVEWAQMDPRLIIMTRQRTNLLRCAYNFAKTGHVGQICMENLGFLLGGGRLTENVKYCLGDFRWAFKLRQLAEELDIAIYATSYDVGVGHGPMDAFGLGGSLLLDLCYKQRIKVLHEGYALKAARRSGEYMSAANCQNLRQRKGWFEIRYREGPVRIRNRDIVLESVCP